MTGISQNWGGCERVRVSRWIEGRYRVQENEVGYHVPGLDDHDTTGTSGIAGQDLDNSSSA